MAVERVRNIGDWKTNVFLKRLWQTSRDFSEAVLVVRKRHVFTLGPLHCKSHLHTESPRSIPICSEMGNAGSAETALNPQAPSVSSQMLLSLDNLRGHSVEPG